MPILEEGTSTGWLRGASIHRKRRQVPVLPFRRSAKIRATILSRGEDIPKVIGGLDPLASEMASGVYGAIFTCSRHSTAVAEMTKLLENIYRCVNIALVNELKVLCLKMGIDIWEVIGAASTKPFGFQAFYPGPGLGGHCIPIDPFYLSWKAREWDFHTRLSNWPVRSMKQCRSSSFNP